jgi:3-isopropylmalate dehydrogenase
MKARIILLPGDGIGPEVLAPAQQCLSAIGRQFGHCFEFEEHLIGGIAIDQRGDPLPSTTLSACLASDAILLGAVGGPRWSDPALEIRPEQGLLSLRKQLGVYANLRPVKTLPALFEISPIKADRLQGVDLMVVRELTGGLYFGEKQRSENQASDLCSYSRTEIERTIHVAARLAQDRKQHVTLVDKANVLETSRLWRQVTSELMARDYPQLAFDIELVDAMAMHLINCPARFDVIVTENLFGDILTDEASMLAGSLGLLPSASIGAGGPALYEPIHGSAPDIAGRDLANPFGAILSVGMLLQHSLSLNTEAEFLTEAVNHCINVGRCTADAGGDLGTAAAGAAVLARLRETALAA